VKPDSVLEAKHMNGSDPTQAPSPERIDLEQVAQLVQALERDLERAQQGAANLDTLRAEVEALRAALSAHEGDDDPLRERLQSVRDAFDEGDTALFKGAQYLADIGRMLGM